MRERPPGYSEYSVIDFDPMTAGMTHARFDMLCVAHGDGDSYSWRGGGDEQTYTVTRGHSQAVIEGWPVSDWQLIVDKGDGRPLHITVDCINSVLSETDHVTPVSMLANEVHWAVIDAMYELSEQDRRLRFLPMQDGTLHPNASYEP